LQGRKKVWCSPNKPAPDLGTDFLFLEEERPKLFQAICDVPPDAKQEMEWLVVDLLSWAERDKYAIFQPGEKNPYFIYTLKEVKESGKYDVPIFYIGYEPVFIKQHQEDGSFIKTTNIMHKCWAEL
jgi:hypothetical protein